MRLGPDQQAVSNLKNGNAGYWRAGSRRRWARSTSLGFSSGVNIQSDLEADRYELEPWAGGDEGGQIHLAAVIRGGLKHITNPTTQNESPAR